MRAFALLLLLFTLPVQAQRAPAPRNLPADPAPAPPAAPELATLPAPSVTPAPRPLPPVILAAGMETLPGGGWRLRGDAAARDRLDAPTNVAMAEIASHLAESTTGRVTVITEVNGPANDLSAARRSSLAAARAVKRALEAGGLDATRIDLRPLGRTATPRGVVDVLPPGVQREGTAAR